MTTFLVIGGIAVLVAGYFALDWLLAGRTGKRTVGRARDGQVGNASVDYDAIERQAQQNQGPGI